MGPTLRLSSVYPHPQTHQLPSLTPINTGVDVTPTIEFSESSKQVCKVCSPPILSPISSLDDRANMQVQRICDICAKAIAQNQNLPVSVADPAFVVHPIFIADPAPLAPVADAATPAPVADPVPAADPLIDDYDDEDCKRKVKCLTYTTLAAIVAIGLFLLLVPGGSADDHT